MVLFGLREGAKSLALLLKYLYLFQITLNNAENATDYIGRLTSALQTELRSLVSQKSQHEREKVENCLAGLPAVGIKLKTVLDQVTCQTISKSRHFQFSFLGI